MQLPGFADGQFVNAELLSSTFQQVITDFEAVGTSLFTPGLTGQSALSSSVSGLVLTLTLPTPFRILFANGVLAEAHGVVNGVDSDIYTINVASLVPGSGTITVHVLAAAASIGLQPVQVIGPPVGHPDFDPNFAPFTLYTQITDTLSITAGTAAANNTTTFEICRFNLSAGQSVITGISFASQLRAGAVLSRNGEVLTADLAVTGVTAGTYPGATVTVGVDGRITGITSIAYGPLAGNNTWTGANTWFGASTFRNTATFEGGAVSNILDDGGLGGQFRAIAGNYGVFLRNDGASALLMQTAAGDQNGTFNSFRPFWWSLANGAVNIDQTGSGTSFGGNIAVAGGISSDFDVTANRNINVGNEVNAAGGISGASLFTTGAITAQGGINGATLNTSGAIAAGGGLNGASLFTSGAIISDSGNVTAINGRLRATFGATGSGDGNAAALLNDFPAAYSQNGWTELPNGIIFQWGVAVTSNGVAVSFPRSFPNGVLAVTISEGAGNGTWSHGVPTVHATSLLNNAQFTHWTFVWNGTGWSDPAPGGTTCTFMAVGF